MANRFIVYGRTTCYYCQSALRLLEEQDLEHVFMDLTDDEHALDEAKEYYGHPTVPIILKNNKGDGFTEFVGGYTDLAEMLGARDY